MRTDIYLLITFDLKGDDMTGLHAAVGPMVDRSRQEPGCLAYEFSVDQARRRAYMIEHFASSAAFLEHVGGDFAQRAAAMDSHLSLAAMIVFGQPDDAARALLPATAIYAAHVDGFTR